MPRWEPKDDLLDRGYRRLAARRASIGTYAAPLGSEPVDYDRYALNVRREYFHFDDEDWRLGRTAILNGLLQRAAIFVTQPARQLWEQQARLNLTRELRRLPAPV